MDRLLFQRSQLRDWLAEREGCALQAVEALAPAEILGGSIDDLAQPIVDRFAVTEPHLTGDRYLVDGVQETRIDVSRDWARAVFDRTRPALIPGHRIEVHETFEGDPEILDLSPSRFTFNPPLGDVRGHAVVVTVTLAADAAMSAEVQAGMKSSVDEAFAKIGEYVGWAGSDIRGFNHSLLDRVRPALERRRQRLETGQSLESALGLPIRRRVDADASLAVEVSRRALVPVAGSTGDRAGQPFLRDEGYIKIIEFLGTLRRLIERLPATFASLPEQGLRDILLLILNNTFGEASGETFSRSGKTDIFVVTTEGPVFIAECKFWAGQKAFVEAVEQLLGYLVWRDTKAALVLFIRENDVTGLSTKALQALRGHAQYIRDGSLVAGNPTVYLHHAGDNQRLVRIALVVVPVPRD